MTALMGSTAHELLAQILARYGSIDAFIARLRVLLDTPTVMRPAAVAPSAGGRHRLAEPTGPGAASLPTDFWRMSPYPLKGRQDLLDTNTFRHGFSTLSGF
ncbi:hypothetical protein ABZ412_35035 [Nocardia sp. NPDC005746]|uniref:hypothetical protein n=1 Tax=Nocardia sp. NPDC005746 TaxID=3157062 RepID=UPI0034091694